MLLAEELLILRMGTRLQGHVNDAAQTGLVAALVCDLILAERLIVEWQAHINDNAIRVIDKRRLNDDLLDDALLLLSGDSTVTNRQPAERNESPRGIWARHVCRRIAVRGRVINKDLPYRWYGTWTCEV